MAESDYERLAGLNLGADVTSDKGVTLTVSAGKTPDPDQARDEKVRLLLQKAHRQWRTVDNTESELRNLQKKDLEFSWGAPYQWEAQDIADRQRDGRPCLTINRLNGPIKAVTNQMRSSRPMIQVNPVDDGADPDTAEVFQGLIRRIELQSDADVVYSTAGDRLVRQGRGYWRIITEYADDETRELEIKLKRVRNTFTVYLDPSVLELDGSDANYGFVIEDVPRDEYIARFPDSKLVSLTAFDGIGNAPPDWMPTGKVRIAEWYWVETTTTEKVFVKLQDGSSQTVDSKRIHAMPADLELPSVPGVTFALLLPDPQRPTTPVGVDAGMAPPPEEPGTTTPDAALPEDLMDTPVEQADAIQVVTIEGRRSVNTRKVKFALINGMEILDGNDDKTDGRDWPGKYIPIVQVVGDEFDIDGKVDYRGMVRDAKDSQRMKNYWTSAMTEAIALAPRAPFIGYAGQFENFEDKWGLANRRNFAYLEANPVPLGNGQMAPLPQRNAVEPAIQSMVYASQQAENDLRATTGYFDVQEGETKKEQSGRAILARQKQGEVATSNYMDNLGYGIRFTGRILLDLIPKVYDGLRVRRILGADNQEKTVAVHAGRVPTQADGQPLPPEQLSALLPNPGAIDRIYDLSVGRYDVSISVGPSYQSRRQEAVDSIMQLIQAVPDVAAMSLDILLDAMDWPGAKQIAKRAKKMIPALQDDQGQGGPPPIPPEVQQQMQAMQAELQQTQQVLQQAQQQLQSKAQDLAIKAKAEQDRAQQARAELAMKAQIEQARLAMDQQAAQMQAQIAMMKAEAEIRQRQAETDLKAHLETMRQQMQLRHDADQAAADRVLAHRQAEADREAESTHRTADRQSETALERKRIEADTVLRKQEVKAKARQVAKKTE